MISIFSAAPTLLKCFPISSRIMPTPTTTQASAIAITICGHLPAGHSLQCLMNSWQKTPAKTRNTDGIHIATLTQYQ